MSQPFFLRMHFCCFFLVAFAVGISFEFLSFSATSSLLPYLTLHMQSIGLTIEEIAIIYLALPFTTFLSPPLTGNLYSIYLYLRLRLLRRRFDCDILLDADRWTVHCNCTLYSELTRNIEIENLNVAEFIPCWHRNSSHGILFRAKLKIHRQKCVRPTLNFN